MLAVLLLNRMGTKRRLAQRMEKAKIAKSDRRKSEGACCRTCMRTEDLVSIFYNKESEQKRSHDLRIITGLEIKMDDGLSQKICKQCIERLNQAIQFRRTSRKSEKMLLDMCQEKPRRRNSTRMQKPIVNNEEKNLENVELPQDDYGYDDIFGDDFQNDDYNIVVKTESNIEMKEKPTVSKKTMVIPNAVAYGTYKCPTCSKEFRMKATYKAHLRSHTNFCVCEACGKRCRNNHQLKEHKRARHGLNKIHKCAYCEYSSATKEALTIHERRHTGERPYVCDHCGATFHRRSNLVQHIAIHLPVKNFQCDMCPKRLKSRKFLQIHKHNAHTGKRYGYLCGICEHRFEKPNKVRAHTRRVHGLPDDQQGPIVRCHLCSKREKSKKRLQVHVYKVHKEHRYRYLCPLCPKIYKSPDHVRRHLVNHHDVPRNMQGPVEKYIDNN